MTSRKSRFRYGVTAVVCLLVGVALSPSWSFAADKIQDVLVRNTAAQPVPVSVHAPTLRASAEIVSGSGGATEIPAGVVVTDFVFSSGDPDCTNYSIGFIENPHGAGHLVVQSTPGQLVQQIHLETGIRSTAEDPLTIGMPVDCATNVFWSGYEG